MNKDIDYEVEQITKNFNPKAIKINGDSIDGYSVLLKDNDFTVWVDVYISPEYNDVFIDWNQFIFYTRDCADAITLKVIADNNVFDLSSSEAIDYLVSMNKIHQNQNGKWYYGG